MTGAREVDWPQTDLWQNPREGRAYLRNAVELLVRDRLYPFWRLGFDVAAPGVVVPPKLALQLLARQLEMATPTPVPHFAARTVITMPKTPGRVLMTSVVLMLWRSVLQRRARNVLGIVRTTSLGAACKRLYRQMSQIQTYREVFATAQMDYPFHRLAPLEAPRGLVTWTTPFADLAPRPLTDLILIDPFDPADGEDADLITGFLRWLEALRLSALSRNRFPNAVVVAEHGGPGGLADQLIDLGYVHVDIPAVAMGALELEIAHGRTLAWRTGETIVASPYTPYQLREIKRSLKGPQFELLYT